MDFVPWFFVDRGPAAVANVLDTADNQLGIQIHVDATGTDGGTMLHHAAWFGEIEVMELLLERGANVNATDEHGYTPLHCAAEYGCAELGALLLDQNGINIEATNYHGETPLHYAANQRSADFVRLLLGRGANANAVTADGWTPLHKAANRDTEIAKALLDHGANTRAKINSGAFCHSMTPLHMGATGNPRFVQLCLEHGAEIGATTDSGMTVMHRACSFGCLGVVKVLVEFLEEREGEAATEVAHGCVVDMIAATTNDGHTALHQAAAGGHLGVVAFLVEFLQNRESEDNMGATQGHQAVDIITAGTNDGHTTLHQAAAGGHLEVLEFLVEFLQNCEANTEAAQVCRAVDIITAGTNDGHTALHQAAKGGHLELVEFLVEFLQNCEANTEATQVCRAVDIITAGTNDGHTALHQAAEGGHLELVEFLVEFLQNHDGEANTEATHCRAVDLIAATTDSGMTALHKAASGGHLEVVWFLVDYLCDKDREANTEATHCRAVDVIAATTDSGMTALHQAASGGHLEVVWFLVDNLCDKDREANTEATHCRAVDVIAATTDSGMTALHQAASGGHMEVLLFLVNYLHDKDREANTEATQGRRAVDMIAAVTNDGHTALHQAATGGHMEVVVILVEFLRDRDRDRESNTEAIHGLAVDIIAATTQSGMTALHQAAAGGHSEVVEFLVEFLVEVVVAFLDREANTDSALVRVVDIIAATTDSGMTALHQAAEGGHLQVVEVLVEFLFEINFLHNLYFRTDVLFRIPSEASQGRHAVDIIAAGTNDGHTALHQAASRGHLEMVQVLTNFLHDDYSEARMEAIYGRAVDIIAATTDSGMTALHQAAAGGHLKVVELLRGHGAHVNAVAASGVTPLHLAAEKMGHKDLVRSLVEESIGEEFVYALKSGVPQKEKPAAQSEKRTQISEDDLNSWLKLFFPRTTFSFHRFPGPGM